MSFFVYFSYANKNSIKRSLQATVVFCSWVNDSLTTFTRIMRLFPIIRVRTYSHYDVYMSRAKLLLPFTCNFHYSYYSLRIVVIFLLPFIHISHWTAQMMDSERAGVLLAAVLIYLRLMHNDFVWLYSTLFRRHRNVMAIRLPTLPLGSTRRFWMRVRNRDWWKLVVFSPECDAFFPTIVSNLRIIKGACHLIHVCHTHMRTLVRAAILRLRCLHACIFWLKSAYATYVNTIMLAAIMSLIALFRSKYCFVLELIIF